jgi:hypothetical protein
MLVESGVNRAETQRHLEGGRSFLAENIEHLQAGQWLGLSRPAKLGALAATKLPLALRRCDQHLRPLFRRNPGGTDQTIAFSDEEIADIQRGSHAVLFMKGLFAVTERIIVFDVVVNKGCFVETFDSDGDFSDVLWQQRPGCFAQAWPIAGNGAIVCPPA